VNGQEWRVDRRKLSVVLVVACSAAVAGYFTGTARAPMVGGYAREDVEAYATVVAPTQRDMASRRYEGRVGELRAALDAMGSPPRALTDDVSSTAEERASSLAARARLRAYDGAPPVVPHSVDEHGAPACLACHERGMRVDGDRIAPAMSHESYASCLQCHGSPGERPRESPLAPSVSTTSAFVGLAARPYGERAYAGAPPTIPHRTFMRERCTTCHGVWATGLASTHPWRQSCSQCHAPSAPLDQRPRSTFEPIGGPNP
jgi:nitrate reductase (cytochrome), electron transfer subunit